MSWVRGSFRRKAEDIDFDGVGQNFKNWIGGSAVNAADGPLVHGGGFVMMSFASGLSASGWAAISAAEFLFSTYGATLASNLLGAGVGFKVIPFAFLDMSGDGISSPVFYFLSATAAMAGDDSIVTVIVKKASQTVGSGVFVTLASNISVHFQAFGWITSLPTTFQ